MEKEVCVSLTLYLSHRGMDLIHLSCKRAEQELPPAWECNKYPSLTLHSEPCQGGHLKEPDLETPTSSELDKRVKLKKK